MLRDLAAAILAFYAGQGLRIYDAKAGQKADGSTEAPVFPYAILAMSSPLLSSDVMLSARERAEVDVTISYHGKNPTSARWAAEKVATLAGAHITTTNRVAEAESVFTSLLREDDDNPEQVVWSGADGFTLTSYPTV